MFARDCWCEVEGGPSVHFIEENDSDFMHLKYQRKQVEEVPRVF